MDHKERAILRTLYDLQIERFTAQGEELDALNKANASLHRAHDRLGQLFRLDVIGTTGGKATVETTVPRRKR